MHRKFSTAPNDRKCPFCPKSYKQASSLSRHIKTSHAEANAAEKQRIKVSRQENFQCPVCQKRFSRSDNMRQHVRISHANLKLSCPKCDKPFWNRKRLTHHYNRCNGRKDYQQVDFDPLDVVQSVLDEVHTRIQRAHNDAKIGEQFMETEDVVVKKWKTAFKLSYRSYILEPKKESVDLVQFCEHLKGPLEEISRFSMKDIAVGDRDYNQRPHTASTHDDATPMHVDDKENQPSTSEASTSVPEKKKRKEMNSFKGQLCVKMTLQRLNEEEFDAFVNTSQIAFTPGEDIEDLIERMIEAILRRFEELRLKGSGWQIKKIILADFHVSKYKPLKGGSSYKNLPDYIVNKHSVLNIKNGNDYKCLLYCVGAARHPVTEQGDTRNNPTTYAAEVAELKTKGIIFPIKITDIPKFEQQNRLCLNIYRYDDVSISPLKISRFEYEETINLLYYDGHYCLITNFDGLLYDQNRHKARMYFCPYCMHGYKHQGQMIDHKPRCKLHKPTRVTIPKKGKNFIKFRSIHRQLRQPLMVYADCEALLKQIHTARPDDTKSYTIPTAKHEACGYAMVPVNSCCDSARVGDCIQYRGDNPMKHFWDTLVNMGEKHQETVQSHRQLVMTEEDELLHRESPCCHICKLDIVKPEDKVRDHCHICGRYRGAAHTKCNLQYKVSRDVVVGFHNSRRYDTHLIMSQIGELVKDDPSISIRPIAKTMEDYLSFTVTFHSKKIIGEEEGVKKNPEETLSVANRIENQQKADSDLPELNAEDEVREAMLGNDDENTPASWSIRFIDTYQFQLASLQTLVNNLDHSKMHALKKEFGEEFVPLLSRKGVYPYDYMDDHARFSETQLPPKAAFFNQLTQEHISDEDYEYAQNVWLMKGVKNMGEYHDIYLKTDALLLCDVFEEFRNICLENYSLDPGHYITIPSLSWDALLMKTKVELEQLTDPDMYMFFEAAIRGGISVISHRHARANNVHMGEDYHPNEPTSFIAYWDINNLYGVAMSQPLPIGGFKWLDAGERERLLAHYSGENVELLRAGIGFALEVDLEYPDNLHDLHNDYPLAPERITIESNMLSAYAKEYLAGQDPPKCHKLVPNLGKKTKYILHHRNLEEYLRLGMRVTKIHRGISFEEEPWMKPYIDFNTMKRSQAVTEFEKDFYKLLNNSVFGKTMEDVRRYKDVRLVFTPERFQKLVNTPFYDSATIFNEDFAALLMDKQTIDLDKPIYAGFAILDMSKLVMFRWHYDYMIPTFGADMVKLLMTDTDSFIYHIKTADLFADMERDSERFDLSNFPRGHPIHSDANKKVLGKMKNEVGAKVIHSFVGLKAKVYALKTVDNQEIKKAKGVGRAVVRKEFNYDLYENILKFGGMRRDKMIVLRSKNHEITTNEQQKISMTAYDDKRSLRADGIASDAYYHWKLGTGAIENEENVEINARRDALNEEDREFFDLLEQMAADNMN